MLTIHEALTSDDFLIVRVDAAFGGRFCRIIHRVRDSSHPTGRHCVLSAETARVHAALTAIGRPHQYDLTEAGQ